jgi:hypothetical protein
MILRDDLQEAILRALDDWTHAEWPHQDPNVTSCYDEDEDDYIPGPCGFCSMCCTEGPHDNCDTCTLAEDYAARANDAGREALALLEDGAPIAGRLTALIQEASRLEGTFGDDPTWGPTRKLAEEIAEDINEHT